LAGAQGFGDGVNSGKQLHENFMVTRGCSGVAGLGSGTGQ
jgi:hypothetical protein